jgi:hypothetical protein
VDGQYFATRERKIGDCTIGHDCIVKYSAQVADETGRRAKVCLAKVGAAGAAGSTDARAMGVMNSLCWPSEPVVNDRRTLPRDGGA